MAFVSLGTSTVAKNFSPLFLITSRGSPTVTQNFSVSRTTSVEFEVFGKVNESSILFNTFTEVVSEINLPFWS